MWSTKSLRSETAIVFWTWLFCLVHRFSGSYPCFFQSSIKEIPKQWSPVKSCYYLTVSQFHLKICQRFRSCLHCLWYSPEDSKVLLPRIPQGSWKGARCEWAVPATAFIPQSFPNNGQDKLRTLVGLLSLPQNSKRKWLWRILPISASSEVPLSWIFIPSANGCC